MTQAPKFTSIDLDAPAGFDIFSAFTRESLQGLYVGLLGPDTVEVSGKAYQRQFIELRGNTKIQFPFPSASWGSVAYFALFAEFQGGQALLMSKFTFAIITVSKDVQLSIDLEKLVKTVLGKNPESIPQALVAKER